MYPHQRGREDTLVGVTFLNPTPDVPQRHIGCGVKMIGGEPCTTATKVAYTVPPFCGAGTLPLPSAEQVPTPPPTDSTTPPNVYPSPRMYPDPLGKGRGRCGQGEEIGGLERHAGWG